MWARTGPAPFVRSPWACGDQAEGQGPAREEQGVGKGLRSRNVLNSNVPESDACNAWLQGREGWGRGRTAGSQPQAGA